MQVARDSGRGYGLVVVEELPTIVVVVLELFVVGIVVAEFVVAEFVVVEFVTVEFVVVELVFDVVAVVLVEPGAEIVVEGCSVVDVVGLGATVVGGLTDSPLGPM